MKNALFGLAPAVAGLAAVSHAAAAQSLAQRVNAVREGVVVMRFAPRPGVCGDGSGSIYTRQRNSTWNDRGSGCVVGPVRVALGRSEGSTVSVRVSVGGLWREGSSGNDLGLVSAAEAARYLVSLGHDIGGRSGSEAVSAAALADSVDIAPELTKLARDANAPLEARRNALYWVGETPLATRELAGLYDGLAAFSLREHFTFVLAQRRDEVAVDKLIDIAQHDPNVEVRKRAMYWLGQTEHPKAIKFLRDLITR